MFKQIRKNIIIVLIISFVFVNFSFGQNRIENNFIKSKRKQAKDLMKDYFLFQCVNLGLINNGFDALEKDRSKQFYKAWLSYIPDKELDSILNYSKKIGGDILFNENADKQSLFGQCLNGYRDAQLDTITNKLANKWVIQEKKLK